MFNTISHWEKQFKSKVRYHYPTIRRAKQKRLAIPRIRENIEAVELSHKAGRYEVRYNYFDYCLAFS